MYIYMCMYGRTRMLQLQQDPQKVAHRLLFMCTSRGNPSNSNFILTVPASPPPAACNRSPLSQ